MSYNFTVTDDYYDPQTGTTGGDPTVSDPTVGDPTVSDPTVGNPDITDRQDSPSLQDYPPSGLPDPGLADYTSGQSDTTKKQMLDAALSLSNELTQPTFPRRLDGVSASSPNPPMAGGPTYPRTLGGGDPTTYPRTLGDGSGGTAAYSPPASPSLPDYTPPSTATATGTASHQLSDADWEAQFTKDNGYFDPNFNSRDAMLYNAQRGDLVIRPQLVDMAKYDSDAKRVLDAIHATPGFDNGPNSADWRSLHNTEISLREKAMLAGTQQQGDQTGTTQTGYNGKLGATPQGQGQSQYGGFNQAAIARLEADRVKEIVPGTLEATLPAAAALRDTLIKDGAQNVGYDPTTNKLHWTGTDGINRALGGMNQAGLLEWADAAAKLKDAADAAAAAAAPPAGNGNGGYPPRNGGYPPAYTPPAPAAKAPPPYAYQGDVAPYNPSTGGFNSVVTGKPIPAAPQPVDPTTGAVQPYNQQRTF